MTVKVFTVLSYQGKPPAHSFAGPRRTNRCTVGEKSPKARRKVSEAAEPFDHVCSHGERLEGCRRVILPSYYFSRFRLRTACLLPSAEEGGRVTKTPTDKTQKNPPVLGSVIYRRSITECVPVVVHLSFATVTNPFDARLVSTRFLSNHVCNNKVADSPPPGV